MLKNGQEGICEDQRTELVESEEPERGFRLWVWLLRRFVS
jgi:hypothetical protein